MKNYEEMVIVERSDIDSEEVWNYIPHVRCFVCSEKSIWVSKEKGIIRGVNYLCISCQAFWYLPSVLSENLRERNNVRKNIIADKLFFLRRDKEKRYDPEKKYAHEWAGEEDCALLVLNQCEGAELYWEDIYHFFVEGNI